MMMMMMMMMVLKIVDNIVDTYDDDIYLFIMRLRMIISSFSRNYKFCGLSVII